MCVRECITESNREERRDQCPQPSEGRRLDGQMASSSGDGGKKEKDQKGVGRKNNGRVEIKGKKVNQGESNIF